MTGAGYVWSLVRRSKGRSSRENGVVLVLPTRADAEIEGICLWQEIVQFVSGGFFCNRILDGIEKETNYQDIRAGR